MPDPNFSPQSCRDKIRFGLCLSLFPFVALLSARAQAESAGCGASAVQIDENVAAIHAKHIRSTDEEALELAHVVLKEKIRGIVLLQVDVDTQGQVIAIAPKDGPKPLVAIFADRLKQIAFVPFTQNGHPVCARFFVRRVTRVFPETGPEFAGMDKFHSLLKKCSDLTAAGSETAELTSVCEQAAGAADPLAAAYFGRDKRLAYVLCATALMRDNRAKEALPYADKAVATADLGFDDISGKAAAYGVRGQARGLTGDLHGADQDLTKAESLERATFEVPRVPERRAFDRHALQSILGFHAEILTAMGRKPDAETLRDEARKM
jgi:hypothetical protein